MDKPNLVTWLSGEDHIAWKSFLNPIQATKPSDCGTSGLKHKLVARFFLSVVCCQMLPFKIPGGWDNAPMTCPRFPECWFYCSSFCLRVNQQSFSGESPLHGKHRAISVLVGCDHRSHIRWPDLTLRKNGRVLLKFTH